MFIVMTWVYKSCSILFFFQVTKRLVSHPCIITVAEMGAARHFLRTSLAEKSQEERYRLLQPTLEINPR